MGDKLAILLTGIVSDSDLHAKWLNTFSYLEYIGFRKIVKSQGGDRLDAETLAHAVEEGRHALLLKKLALKTGGSKYNTYALDALLCGAEAEGYFQTLDNACESQVRFQAPNQDCVRLTYLYVTWLVELRALSVYGLYQEALRAAGIPAPLNGLLAEEDKHLGAVERELFALDPDFAERAAKLKEMEASLYQDFLFALARDLAPPERVLPAHA